MTRKSRDHGGGIDAAAARFGGARAGWIDLSTGINPVPYPIGQVSIDAWTELPDTEATIRLLDAARAFWNVPQEAAIVAAPGASALIRHIPLLRPAGTVDIPRPTYNEHWAAFEAAGWAEASDRPDARVLVHPNNPTGIWHEPAALTAPLTVIDESFCDVAPEQSLIAHSQQRGQIVLKSFGKFWGLAGLRLGFAIGHPQDISALGQMLGPWAVSGPALQIGARALSDHEWAHATRTRLQADAARLDALMTRAGAGLAGGTTLFRLYSVDDCQQWQERLAHHRIWTRVFPYSRHYLRLGLPAPQHWQRLEAAL
ncbi:threonine-phosphate decarboxylase [Thalassovita sp.]|uniref:threonine-phosphate decarboxylase n=1 Tax=Thalassovita sp. TaxID=1979401 RepID=UPI0029DE77F3|nr:threonine-phosphate decarboxylase [Thalassovita sp.]